MKNSIFHEDLVQINMDHKDRFDVITSLGNLLLTGNYVKDSFCNAVIQRENEMATGLPTNPFGVAIPHTYSEHVKKTAIAISILNKPVAFQLMGDDRKEIDVEIVFLLSISKSEQQIEILKRLANFFHNPENLTNIRNATTRAEVVSILQCEIEN